jgi:hypothetical protein
MSVDGGEEVGSGGAQFLCGGSRPERANDGRGIR